MIVRMDQWWWIVYGLAVARLTGILTTDVITEPARNWVLRRLNPDLPTHQQFAYLIGCQWCASIWVAAAVIPAAWFLGASPWLQIPALIFAASQLTGVISNHGR